MIRKDSALDADRPRYYSQFWIDVASGKRSIGAGETATAEHEDEEPEALFDGADAESEDLFEPPAPKPIRQAKPKAEPKRPEPQRPALTSLADLAKIDSLMKSSAEMDDDTVPDIEGAAMGMPGTEDSIVTDFDPSQVEAAAAEEEEPVVAEEEGFGDVEFDEDDWGSDDNEPRRGSKPSKRQRREPRRDF